MRKLFTNYSCFAKQFMRKYLLLAFLLGAYSAIGFASSVPEMYNLNNFQQRKVSGRVIDKSTKEPLPGVNITIKGTTQGTVTDFDGNYTLEVKEENAILVYSFIGYANQEITLVNQSVINVELGMDISDLDEVVVVAYGTQKKSNLTGSVATVQAKDIKTTNTSPSITERLKGRAAGVQVISSSNGKPGEAASVKIRGISTLAGNTSPLWVVDGMQYNSAPIINPDDIEDVSILKDASSSALYGSRAAAGVIVITTKKGSKERKEINFSYRHGISTRDMGNFKVMNSKQLYDHFSTFWSPDYYIKANEMEKTLRESDPNMSDQEIQDMINLVLGTRDSYVNSQFLGKYPDLDTCTQILNTNTNWEDFAFRIGKVDEYNINFTGGGENYTTFFSGGYYNEEGILKGQDYERYTGNLNLNYQPHPRLTIDTKIDLTYTKRFEQDGGSLYNTFIYMPWDTAYNKDGSIREILNGSSADGRKWYGRDEANYLYERQYNYSKSTGLNNKYKSTATLKITEDISLEHSNNLQFGNGYSFWNADERTASGKADDSNGKIGESYSKSIYYLTNTFIRFKKTIGEHNIQVMGGYEYSKSSSSYLSATGTGIVPGAIIMDASAKADPNNGAITQTQLQSALINANYVFLDRYLFQGSLRYDESSIFFKENRGGVFYTLSAGWIVTKEDFLKNNNILNYLKLRAGYGTLGNLYGNPYQAFGIYGFGFEYNDVPGLFPNRKNLDRLTWEKKADINFAVDFRLIDRIDGTIEFYQTRAIDLYGWKQLPSLGNGMSTKLVNFGGIANKGIEITLNPNVIKTNDFRWDINFNINFNKNEVTRIDDAGTEMLDRGTQIWLIGKDSRTFYMREWAGVDPATGDPLWNYKRKNADGTFTDTVTNNWNIAEKRVQDKSATPKFYGGFGTTIDYKGFTLSTVFNYSYGNYIYFSGMSFFDNDGAYAEYNQMIHDADYVRWEKPGDIATHPKAVYGGNKLSHNTSTRYLYDGSYLKWGNITLAYTFLDKEILKKVGVQEIKLTATVDNIHTFTKFPGVNPEVNGYAGNDVSPIIRKFMIGANIRF